MNRTKNNHYVPQMLLKNFSLSKSHGRVHVYDLLQDKKRDSQAVANIASENYFYKQEIEDRLCALESELKHIFGGVIRSGKLVQPQEDSCDRMKLFMAVQISRTRRTANQVNDLVDKVAKYMIRSDSGLSEDDPLKRDIDKFKLQYDDPTMLSIDSALRIHRYMGSLGIRLLVNNTKVPFVISDDPAVSVNPYLQARHDRGGNLGVNCVGIQMFLPISPRYCIMLYDPEVYTVGTRRGKIPEIPVENKDDVNTVNLFQATNAVRAFYFNCQLSENDQRRLASRAKRYRVDELVKLEEATAVMPDGSHRTIIRTVNIDPEPPSHLTFCRVSPHMDALPFSQKSDYYRYPSANDELCEEFYKHGRGATLDDLMTKLVKQPLKKN